MIIPHDYNDGFDVENRLVGTSVFDEYPNEEEWLKQFDFTKPADMGLLEPAHFGHLPIWTEGNAYIAGAKAYKKEINPLIIDSKDVKVELVKKEDGIYLDTNVYDMIGEFEDRLVHSDILGCAFEPGQRFENADGTAIVFDADYFDEHRGAKIIPGPLASKDDLCKPLYKFN